MHLSAKTLEPQNKILIPGEVSAVSIWQDEVAICAVQNVQIDYYSYQLIGVPLKRTKPLPKPAKKKKPELISEESINTESSNHKDGSHGATPGHQAITTPDGGATPGEEQDLSEGEQDGTVYQIVPFKTLPYFLIRKDDFI